MRTPTVEAVPGTTTQPMTFRPAKPKKSRSNVQVVKDLMEFSHYGALAQCWIMDTLCKEAKRQAEYGVQNWPDGSIISADAWHGVACEIDRKLSEAGYK